MWIVVCKRKVQDLRWLEERKNEIRERKINRIRRRLQSSLRIATLINDKNFPDVVHSEYSADIASMAAILDTY